MEAPREQQSAADDGEGEKKTIERKKLLAMKNERDKSRG